MSAFAYHEPYRFSSGVLTLLMHVLFFAALYLGVNWHVQQPQGMQVDLWADLPEATTPPAPAAPPVATSPEAPQKAEPAKPKEAERPAPPAKADIELAQKKKLPAAGKAAKPQPRKKSLTKAEQKRAQAEMQAAIRQEEIAEQQAQEARDAQAARAAGARAAVTGEVEKYKGLIRSKIRRYIVMPPDVADDAVAEFAITLLTDGSLLEVKQIKSSGNRAYDSAVERAIRKAEPLPLPKDEEAKKQFINPNHPHLKFSPRDGG